MHIWKMTAFRFCVHVISIRFKFNLIKERVDYMTQGSFHQTLKNRFKRWNKKSRFMMSINFTQQHFVWLHFFKNKILVLWVLGGGGDWYLIFNFETPCMLLLLMMVSRDPRNNYRLVNRVNMIMMVKEKWQPAKKMCDLWINTCVLPTGTPSTSPVFYSR